MKKTLRIFANDTRHFWPEISLTLAITAVFALTQSSTWPGFPHHLISQRDAESLISTIPFVLILVWYLVVARVVLEDPLAGDQQLWISRPVGWPALLAAKLLFLAAFILVPIFIAQVYILHLAGFNALHVLPALGNQMLTICEILLPALVLASLSPSLKRLILYAIACVAWIYVSSLATIGLQNQSRLYVLPAGFDWISQISHWLFLLASIAVVLIQYSRRRTALSFIVLAVALLCSSALDIARDYHRTLREYPMLSSQEQPLAQIAYNPDSKSEKLNPILADDSEADLNVPVSFSHIVPGHIIVVEGSSTTVEAPGVAPTTIPWTGYATVTNGMPYVFVVVPGSFIRKAAGKQLTLHVTYAISELEPTFTTTLIAGGQTLNVPDDGHCYQYSGADQSVCLYAGQYRGYKRFSWIDRRQCGVSSPADLPREVWTNSFYSNSGSGGKFSPVVALNRVFPIHDRQVETDLYFCPNTPLTFTSFRVVRRRRMQVTLPPIDPQLYNTTYHHQDRDY
jgi:hypothetical protein